MPNYLLRVSAWQTWNVEIEADSPDDARQAAWDDQQYLHEGQVDGSLMEGMDIEAVVEEGTEDVDA